MQGLGTKGKEELADVGEDGARGTLWLVWVEHAKKGWTPAGQGKAHTRIQGEVTRAGVRISVLLYCDEKSHTL